MAKSALLMPFLLAACSFGAERTLQFATQAQGIQELELRVGAGDVEITGCQCQEVRATVALSGKRWQVEKLEIRESRQAGKLTLSLAPADHARRHLSEDWTLTLPANLAVAVKVGVGDVVIRQVAGAIRVEVGVGDVRVQELQGQLDAETGVGDIEVRGSWEAVGAVALETGVGDVRLLAPQRRERGEGLVSKSLQLQGPGPHPLKATTGVGDITVRLQSAGNL